LKEDKEARLPKEKSEKRSPQITIKAIGRLQSGPILPPEVLEGYKRIDESFLERILRIAEREQAFGHKSYSLGQIFAFSVVLIALLCATYLGLRGKEWLGGGIGLGALASIAIAYFYSHKRSEK